MGLFDKIFKSEGTENKEEKSKTPWIDLNSMSQLDEIEKASEDKTVAILKHSTRCGVSKMVLRMFESDYNLEENEAVQLYFLDLISYRDISNEIANRFKVRHESPQLIVLQNREVVHHASHQQVQASKLQEFVN